MAADIIFQAIHYGSLVVFVIHNIIQVPDDLLLQTSWKSILVERDAAYTQPPLQFGLGQCGRQPLGAIDDQLDMQLF